MKVGIITITDGQNYGNRLQNFAMQHILLKLGCDPITIKRKTYRDKTALQKLKHQLKRLVKKMIGRKCYDLGARMRKSSFDQFNKSNIRFSQEYLHDNIAPPNYWKQYDYFICGSDQIWNARFGIIKNDLRNYLASFAKPEQKIAYAASFGTNDIAPGYEKIFAELLPTFKAIGVREDSGVSIVKKSCGREDVEVVLDPTMMLTDNEWNKIASKPSYIENEKIIVTYFLGGRSESITSYINLVSSKYNARAINLDVEFLSDDKIEDKNVFATSPSEFVWLISHAECVLTDSYHACVFAILYRKPFCVFQRKSVESGNNMGTRISTLLDRFHLNAFLGDLDHPTVLPSDYDHDYIASVLESERTKSLDFLKDNLSS